MGRVMFSLPQGKPSEQVRRLQEAVTDLTPKQTSGKLEGLPRRLVLWLVDGVCPVLENSTACQKSMPSPSWWGCGWLPLWWLVVSLRDFLSFG